MQLDKLTKKNQEFIKIATHQLIQDGKADAEIKSILEDILPQIEANQKQGITARGFLGAPTAWASSFTPKNLSEDNAQKSKNSNPWLMWLDTSLLFIGVVSLVSALSKSFNNQSPSYGIFSILALGFGGGAAMYLTYHFLYKDIDPSREGRLSITRALKAYGLAVVVWILAWLATAFLPATINIVLSNLALLVLAVVSFVIKYVLNKKYNILNTLSPIRH